MVTPLLFSTMENNKSKNNIYFMKLVFESLLYDIHIWVCMFDHEKIESEDPNSSLSPLLAVSPLFSQG